MAALSATKKKSFITLTAVLPQVLGLPPRLLQVPDVPLRQRANVRPGMKAIKLYFPSVPAAAEKITERGAQKLMEENLKVGLAEFSI